jgi:hypothetical protein
VISEEPRCVNAKYCGEQLCGTFLSLQLSNWIYGGSLSLFWQHEKEQDFEQLILVEKQI